jgi:hypothetical protein
MNTQPNTSSIRPLYVRRGERAMNSPFFQQI